MKEKISQKIQSELNIHIEKYNYITDSKIIKHRDFLRIKESSLLANYVQISYIKNSQSINFDADIWDIRMLSDFNEKTGKTRLYFDQIDNNYKDAFKGYIYKLATEDNLAARTIQRKYYEINSFINHLSVSNIIDIRDLNPEDIKKYLDSFKVKYTSLQAKRVSIEEFLFFVIDNYEDVYLNSVLKFLKELDYKKELKAEYEAGKTPAIPDFLFQRSVKVATLIIGNKNASIQEKVEASIVLLLSQTGIRISEVRLLKKDKLRSIRIFDEDKEAYYLHYSSPKAKKIDTKTFLTNLGVMAYNCLCECYSNDASDYIFYNPQTGVPLDENTLRATVIDFYIRNYKSLDNKGLKNISSKELSFIRITNSKVVNGYYIKNEFLNEFEIGDIIYYPLPHQFRVSVCNELIKQGITLDWVRDHMNHLDPEMTAHYIRKSSAEKKNQEFAKQMLAEMITGETVVLGKDSEILMNKINEFIKENKYNIKRDLAQIVEELAGRIPIREKELGYCIKSSFGRKCAHDGYGSDVYCVFGVCPNHFTIYKLIDVSYGRYKNLVDIINYNKENGFSAQVEIETNKLKRVVEEAVLPELIEINRLIDKNGLETLCMKNKDIEYYIRNANELIAEVRKWIK